MNNTLNLPTETRLDKIELSVDMKILDKSFLLESGFAIEVGNEFRINVPVGVVPHLDSLKSGMSLYDGKIYNKMQLSVSVPDGNNIIGLKPFVYYLKFHDVCKKLYEDYRIKVNEETAKITMLEMQRTFEIEASYNQYERVLKQVIKNIPYKMYCYTCGSHRTENKTKSKYVQYQFYNKGEQLNFLLEKDILRFEIKIKGSQYIKKIIGNTSFFELNQSDIENVFQNLIQKNIVKVLERKRIERDKELLKLMKSLKKYDTHWITSTLLRIADKEITKDCPWYLDIEEVINVVELLELSHKGRTKEAFRKNAEKYFTALCNGDNRKLTEIINKLTVGNCQIVN